MRWVAAAACTALVLSACGDDSPSRSDVMAGVASEIAVPAFGTLKDAADELDAAVTSACEAPNRPEFDRVLDAVDAATAAWYESEAVWIGPVMERRSTGLVDWPIHEDEIAELLQGAKPGELSEEYLGRSIGADNRGFGAIAWVASSPPELAGVDPAVRCEYLDGVAAVAASEVDVVLSSWTESYDGGAPYSETLAGDSGGDVEEQIDMLVNDTLGTLESMRDSAEAAPAPVQAARLRGEQRLYTGSGEQVEGLAPLLGDDLIERLAGELETAVAAYEHDDVTAGAAAATDVQRTVATEVVSRLGVTVLFSDADGDGGG